jgi:hypothetical protein
VRGDDADLLRAAYGRIIDFIITVEPRRPSVRSWWPASRRMALPPHAAFWLRAHSCADRTLAATCAAERMIARRWHLGHGPGRVCRGQDLGGSCANRRRATGADSDLTAFGFIVGVRASQSRRSTAQPSSGEATVVVPNRHVGVRVVKGVECRGGGTSKLETGGAPFLDH